MAKVVTDDSHYKAIADTIREQLDDEESTFLPEDMPSMIAEACGMQYSVGFEAGYTEGDDGGFDEGFNSGFEEGFNNGCEVGYGDGYEEGHRVGKNEGTTEGKQAEYDRFWDEYQENGNKTNYTNCFSGRGWNAETFKPKYNIAPTTPTQIFKDFGASLDLVEHLEALGITLDFSRATTLSEIFLWSNITRVGVVDSRNASAVTYPFAYATKLQTIDKLILKDDGTQTVGSGTFGSCSALVNLTIEGTIGSTGLSLQAATKLSKASITSIVNALSAAAGGLSVTFSRTAVNNAFTTDEWSALAGTRSNWTINLV